jgi:hypothetical protein
MKISLASFFSLFLASTVYSQGSVVTVDSSWDDVSIEVDNMDDYDFLVIRLPMGNTEVTAEIIQQSQILGEGCQVVAIRNFEGHTEVILQLGETNRDDGWNGCTADIYRNAPGDEDGVGILSVDFGYGIDT